MNLLRQLSYLFGRREKMEAAVLCALMILGAFIETIGIGMIMPFIGLIGNPDLINKSPKLAWLYQLTRAGSPRTFILYCGAGIVALYLFKTAYVGSLAWVQSRFVADRQVGLARRLLTTYLHQPYAFHLNHNSAGLIHNLSATTGIFDSVFMPLTTVVVECTVLTTVLVMLFLVEPVPAIGALAILGTLTLVFYRSVRSRLNRISRERRQHSAEMVKWIQQGLGGVKEAKVLGREAYFIESYSTWMSRYTGASLQVQIMGQLPRLFIELVGVVGTVLILCIMILQGRDLATLLPTLALFGLALVRLMPSLTRITSSVTVARSSMANVEAVYEDLKAYEKSAENAAPAARGAPLGLAGALELRDLSFRYPDSAHWALRNVSLTIPRGQSMALVGPSGAGKTTLVDLILGLLSPTEGAILADGGDIARNLGPWQRSIGYIPQTIYLSDDTIRRNVAFGVPDGEIDDAKVWAALRAAQLESFVRSLPGGLETMVGERGARLSGGQRQRIGIARALYNNPDVLILDEATSALDNETEAEVARAIEGLSGSKTIIVIAHRLTTARMCQRVYKIVEGRVAAAGSFTEVCGNI